VPQEPDVRFEKINAHLLLHFPDVVRDLGGDVPTLLAASGIEGEGIAEIGGELTYRQIIALLESAARILSCPDFGMRLAQRQQGGAFSGPLGQVMRNSHTFGDAVRFACEHSNAHSSAARVWQLELAEEGRLFAGHELLLGNVANWEQTIEQVLLLGHLEAMGMTGGYARARRVHFRHEAVSSPEIYRRHFGCEVRFGEPADGLVFSREDFASPILRQNEQAHQDLVSYVERTFPQSRLPVQAEVRGLIMRRLAGGDSSSSEVARAMHLHGRTLRRRLKAEGLHFQQVKDEVRRDLTGYYIQRTQLDFKAISEKLGFAEQSVFSRCCKRWFGMSPSALRLQALLPTA